MNRVETMVGPELREYKSQNKHTLGSKMKATIKKVSIQWSILCILLAIQTFDH
jgi:hypothetical protein